MRGGNIRGKWRQARGLVAGLLCSCAFWGLPALALDPERSLNQYRMEGWESSRGLPQNSVQDLLQTQQGYLLIATQEGIARFDGHRFTVWDTANTPELGTNDIRALAQTADGALWVGTNGKGLLRRTESGWTGYGLEEGLAGLAVLELALDHEGALWVGTQSGLSYQKGSRFFSLGGREGLPSGIITKICPGAPGDIWVGTENGLAKVSGGRVEALPLPADLQDHAVLALLWDTSTRELWVGTRGGLVRGLPGHFRKVALGSKESQLECWSFHRDRSGALWVGTSGGIFRIRGGRIESLGPENGLLYPVVSVLLEDREGSLWIGTQSGGLNRLKDGPFTTFGTAQGVQGDFVWTVFQDRDGAIWIGTDRGGVTVFHEGQFRHFGPPQGLTAYEATAIGQSADGTVWVGGRNSLFRKEGNRFVEESRVGGPRGRIRAILGTPEGDLWVATHGNGLFRKRGKDPFRQYTVSDGLPSLFLRALHWDRRGNLWVSTSGYGLALWAGDRFVRPEGSERFNAAYILSISEDRDGGLWFCTSEDGVIYYDGKSYRVFDRRAGIPVGALYIVLEDEKGYLWITSNRGIYRVSRSALISCEPGRTPPPIVEHYGVADGMGSSECNGGNQPGGLLARDGSLWFPTMKGVSVTHPGRLEGMRTPPELAIEEVVVDGQEIAAEEGLYTLDSETRSLVIHFTALYLGFPNRVRFRYQLQGYDPDWIEAGKNRAAHYTGVPPGNYTFRLLAGSGEGAWNPREASIRLFKAPRWYQRRLVQFAGALSLAGGIFWVFRWRVRTLRQKQEALENLVKERTANLTALNEQLALLARTDALTGLANYRIFYEHLREEWRRCARVRAPLAVIVADVDHFKQFNDAFGHLEGDRCLRDVARAVAQEIHRPGDLVARYGGEEFAVILSETTQEGALHVAEQLRACVKGLKIAHPSGGEDGHVTISLGVATAVPEVADNPEDLLMKADAALYRAKAEGRNRVVCAPSGD